MVWLLVMLWLLFGLLAGALGNAARLGFAARGLAGRYATWATLALGVVAALIGGLLGWLALGRFFATPTALWVAVLAVTAGPWLAQRAQEWRSRAATQNRE
jgi:hypothetical protein